MADKDALTQARRIFEEMLPPGEPTIDELRAAYSDMMGRFPIAPDADITAVTADGVPCLWITAPGAHRDKVIVFYHGGGFVLGCAEDYRALGCELSRETGCVVLLVDYRRAPENPYPAAIEDALAAYRWAKKHDQVSWTAVAGDSAGGGLAISTCLGLRDAEEPPPSCCIAISPFVDLNAQGESMSTKAAEDPLVQEPMVKEMAAAYLPQGRPEDYPLASPLYATDFTRLPPILILVGTAETLLDDSLRLARRLSHDGNDILLRVAADMIHVWPIFFSFLDEAKAAIRTIGSFLKEQDL